MQSIGFARAGGKAATARVSCLLAYRRIHPVPYLFTEADIDALLAAVTAVLRHPLRAATHRALFGLLAVTGMREGEAIGLDRGDVGLTAGG